MLIASGFTNQRRRALLQYSTPKIFGGTILCALYKESASILCGSNMKC